MIEDSIVQRIAEADDLDWKQALPPTRALNETDFPKDIAAMANSGGGIIVYGVAEQQKRASGRVDVGELTENHERTLRSAAVNAIVPPVFNLEIISLGGEGSHCVAIVVPASDDGPHLIYKNDYFGAPLRNDADTIWMRERQVEAAYRARFDERRYSFETLDRMFRELSVVTHVEARAWLIAVGRPRGMSSTTSRWTRTEAHSMFEDASARSLTYMSERDYGRPFDIVSTLNPLPGLRRWIARTHRSELWREASTSIHFDGSVSLAVALGGHRTGPNSQYEPWEFDVMPLAAAIADFMGLVQAVGVQLGSVEYEVRVGIVRNGPERMAMYSADRYGFLDAQSSAPIHAFIPVDATVEVGADDVYYLHQVRGIIQDCLNQGGISALRGVAKCTCDECSA